MVLFNPFCGDKNSFKCSTFGRNLQLSRGVFNDDLEWSMTSMFCESTVLVFTLCMLVIISHAFVFICCHFSTKLLGTLLECGMVWILCFIVSHHLGPNCLQRYQQKTKVAASTERGKNRKELIVSD